MVGGTQEAFWVAHSGAGIVLIGDEGNAETLRLQRFLRRNGYPHSLVSKQDCQRFLNVTPVSDQQESWPAVAFSNGRLLHRPTLAALADELGISELPDATGLYDVAIVGAGPAGLAAAEYAFILEGDGSFCVRTVVIATGAQYRKPSLANLEIFENQGIYYAATGTGSVITTSVRNPGPTLIDRASDLAPLSPWAAAVIRPAQTIIALPPVPIQPVWPRPVARLWGLIRRTSVSPMIRAGIATRCSSRCSAPIREGRIHARRNFQTDQAPPSKQVGGPPLSSLN